MKTGLTTLLLVVCLLGGPVGTAQDLPAIVLAPSIHVLDPLLEYDLKAWLDRERPGGTHLYAVMSYTENTHGIFISLAGLDPLTPLPYAWSLEDGNVIWHDTLQRLEGEFHYYQPFQAQTSRAAKVARLVAGLALGGAGGGPEIAFPWLAGTKMQYGTRGIHGGGFNFGSGVDFVSGEDMGVDAAPPLVYASADGAITDVCRDDTSVAVFVESAENSFGYFHLVDAETLETGTEFTKGQVIGQLVAGTFEDTCGWAAQQENHYHLHWVVEMASGKYQAEGWQLRSSDGKWHRGDEVIATGKWMYGGGGAGFLEDDPGNPPVSPLVIVAGESVSGGGNNLWDYLITAINTIYGLFKQWYAPNGSPINPENEKMWTLAINMLKTMVKDANVYLINDTLNILPLVWVYLTMFFLESLKWVVVTALSVFNLVKDVKGLVTTS